MENELSHQESKEIVDIHDTMLEKFFAETDHILDSKIPGIPENELKEKFVELFNNIGNEGEFSDFEKRLFKAYKKFSEWLENKWEADKQAFDITKVQIIIGQIQIGILERYQKREKTKKTGETDDDDNLIRLAR